MCDQFWIFNYRCLHSVNFANVVKDVKDVIGLNDVTNVNNVNDVVTVKNIPMEIIIIIIISIPSTISMISIASMMSMSNANFSRSDLVTLAPRHGQSMQHRMGFKVSTGRERCQEQYLSLVVASVASVDLRGHSFTAGTFSPPPIYRGVVKSPYRLGLNKISMS